VFLHFAIIIIDHYGNNEFVIMKNVQFSVKPWKKIFYFESDKQKKLGAELVLKFCN